MAAPIKQFADYFPHGAGERSDERSLALRKKFGLEGYAVHCMMQEVLTGKDRYMWRWDDLSLELLAGDLQIEVARLVAILEYMVKIRLYSRDDEYLWSDDLIANFNSLMERRRQQREAKSKKAKKKKGEIGEENNSNDVVNDQVGDENPGNDGKSATTSQNNGDGFFYSDQVSDENQQRKRNQIKSRSNQKEGKRKDQIKSNETGSVVDDDSDRASPGLQGEKPGTGETEEHRWQRQRAGLFRQIGPRLGMDLRDSRPEAQDKLLADQKTILGILDEVYDAKYGQGTRFSIIVEQLLKFAGLAGGPNVDNPMGYWIRTCRREILGQAVG